jgi:regulator of protease activity HflC (stomatin/prohibitin superfamily)
MFKWIAGGVAFLLTLIFMFAFLERVPAGYIGVKFNKFGGNKGVQLEELSPGYYWLGWNWTVYLFPTFTQNETWTEKKAITFQSEGMSLIADIGITYHIAPDKASLVFQKYRRGIDEITDTFLHNMTRDELARLAAPMSVEEVYSKKKADLIDAVQKGVQSQVSDIGIVVEKIYWIGALELPDQVKNSINLKIQADQIAQQKRNEVAQAQADAEKEVAKANGDARALLARRQAEADGNLAVSTADAKGIQLRTDALKANPELIQYTLAQKWNGALPTQMIPGTAVPLLSLPGK